MKFNLFIICLLGAITIVLGAFGAHSLQNHLSEIQLKSFETAVRYQMYHVLLLLFLNLTPSVTYKSKRVLNYIFYLAIFFFSGSIYAITFGVNPKYIWFITPLGGLLFVIGWLKLGFDLYNKVKRL